MGSAYGTKYKLAGLSGSDGSTISSTKEGDSKRINVG
jgi:hypothetical protein